MDGWDLLSLSRDQKLALLNSVMGEENGIREAYPYLKLLLRDEDPEVRKLVVAALWDYPIREIIDPLSDIVRYDPAEEVRCKAVVTLGRFVYEGEQSEDDFTWAPVSGELPAEQVPKKQDFLRVKDLLFELIQDDKQPLDVRRCAIEAISFLNAPEVDTVIEQAYQHPDPKMKISAIFAMGRNKSKRWFPILLRELDSEDPQMQIEAVRAAGEAMLKEAAPKLMELAVRPNRDLQLEAIWALGNTGGEGVYEFIKRYTYSEDADIREVAQAALEGLNLFSPTDQGNDE